MLDQLRRVGGNAAALQVSRAGASNAHHIGQRCGDQPCIGQRACPKDQVDFTQVCAMQVDEAVDQAQLYIQARVGDQKIGNGRGQVSAPKSGWRIDTDQALWGAAQGNRLSASQAQFFDNAPGAFSEGQPCGRRPYGMGAAHEQLAAKGCLQAVDSPCNS
ncbi:hypothetical protein D9M71_139210 [compost metagenome]